MSQPSALPPRVALVLKVDTFGDLVLFAPALRALREAWAGTRLVVLVRRAYLDLAPLLAPGIEWLDTTIDPFSKGPDADQPEFALLRATVATLGAEVAIAATSRRNWLDAALAAASGASRRVALGADLSDTFFSTQLRLHFGVDDTQVFAEKVVPPEEEPDWQRNLRLVDALLGRTVARTPPALKVNAEGLAAGAQFLAHAHLAPGRYVVCAAAGFANVQLKTWPAPRFAAALRHLRERHGLRTLLIGHESERAYLESVAAEYTAASRAASPASTSTPPAGEPAPVIFTGREGSLPTLAALIADAALFLGNDTGAMHLAGALDVPVVAVFGGGTWPRFAPAGRRSLALVQPLPCFGCGWDCAFGDAPCLGGITVAEVTAALDLALARRAGDFSEIRRIQHIDTEALSLVDRAAARYRQLRAEHQARQERFETTVALASEKDAEIAALKSAANEKDAEIAALKRVCDEREQTIFILDRNVRGVVVERDQLKVDSDQLKKSLAELHPDAAKNLEALANKDVHIRNIEAMLRVREQELKELRIALEQRSAGFHDLEQAKHYGRLLAEKEAVIQSLARGLEQREAVIRQLTAEATHSTSDLRKAWIAISVFVREKLWRPFDTWLFRQAVEQYWMQIGVLRHYEPRPLQWDTALPRPRLLDADLPQVAIVTPSYGQEKFIERTMLSVLGQNYPRLLYVVQDGASRDRSAEIIALHAGRLHHWESVKDAGQADAVRRGFAHLQSSLGPNDVMAWINSDDLFAPGALRYVAEYFATHPEVDVIYGHRIIIDDDDREVGRWIMPRHHATTLEWIDYVPQETMFWRKRAWDLAGGIDPSFQFALDWDLLARFHLAGCRIVRLPYFLGGFRVHAAQKTSQAIHTTGAEEMRRIRTRFHGERQDDFATIDRYARRTRFRGALVARLMALGIRW